MLKDQLTENIEKINFLIQKTINAELSHVILSFIFLGVTACNVFFIFRLSDEYNEPMIKNFIGGSLIMLILRTLPIGLRKGFLNVETTKGLMFFTTFLSFIFAIILINYKTVV
jgi:hypothetical protein